MTNRLVDSSTTIDWQHAQKDRSHCEEAVREEHIASADRPPAAESTNGDADRWRLRTAVDVVATECGRKPEAPVQRDHLRDARSMYTRDREGDRSRHSHRSELKRRRLPIAQRWLETVITG